ncbi:hypothetical protein, partial [Salinibacter sp.]|uniref:hypothetical protein n=2 Tax=Salinibacter sp. TaxID=2065818 RepID=UPI0021E88FC3
MESDRAVSLATADVGASGGPDRPEGPVVVSRTTEGDATALSDGVPDAPWFATAVESIIRRGGPSGTLASVVSAGAGRAGVAASDEGGSG